MEHAGKKRQWRTSGEGVRVSSDVAKGMHTHTQTHTQWRTRWAAMKWRFIRFKQLPGNTGSLGNSWAHSKRLTQTHTHNHTVMHTHTVTQTDPHTRYKCHLTGVAKTMAKKLLPTACGANLFLLLDCPSTVPPSAPLRYCLLLPWLCQLSVVPVSSCAANWLLAKARF